VRTQTQATKGLLGTKNVEDVVEKDAWDQFGLKINHREVTSGITYLLIHTHPFGMKAWRHFALASGKKNGGGRYGKTIA